MIDIKLFNRWDTKHIEVQDPGLKGYINVEPRLVPRSSGRFASQRFYRNKYSIVERLMNRLMVPGHKGKKHYITSGHCGGKSATVNKIMEKTLVIIEQQTKKNPVEILVRAIENGSPREEVTSIEYGGARYSQAVDASPQRRVDITLRFFVQGAYQKSFAKKISIEKALSNEIIFAYQCDSKSLAVQRKLEAEKQADSAR
tara:strand:+ start:27300 stop:27899 length:600 start_codon:yes stop_codon:yes gene_type:complete